MHYYLTNLIGQNLLILFIYSFRTAVSAEVPEKVAWFLHKNIYFIKKKKNNNNNYSNSTGENDKTLMKTLHTINQIANDI